MKIAIDISPLKLKDDRSLAHAARGSGFYTENLKRSLLKYFPKNKYIFFTRGEKLPKDIGLVHYPYFEPFFLTLPIVKTYKSIVTIHDLIPLVFPDHFPSGIKGKIKWQIQRLSLKKINAVITDSKSSQKDIAKFTGMPIEKIHVVYLAAGEEFRTIQNSSATWQIRIKSLKKKYNLPDKFVLYVGDVTWNKNLHRLVEAIKKINITLVMVGKAISQNNFDRQNSWNNDLIKVQELIKNDQRFIRLGFIPTEDLVCLYNFASVFVMPSLYEGFGLPVLEAMSCGCPVVTSKEGSIPEVAKDAVFYVNPYDVTNIANGIGEVFYNKGLQEEFIEKGLRQSKNFSWRKTAKDTAAVYEKVNSI